MRTFTQLKLVITLIAILLSGSWLSAKKSNEGAAEDILQNRKSVFSQNKQFLNYDINNITIEEHILSNWKNLKHPACGLEFISEKFSPGGKHYAFRQTVYDIPVYQTYLKVNLDHNHSIRSTFDNSYDISSLDLSNLLISINAFDKEKIEKNTKALYSSDVIFHQSEMILLFTNETSEPLPFLSLDYEWPSHFAIERILINSEGNVIHTIDLKTYHEDRIMVEVPAAVFNPDPLTTAGVTYGGAYTDQNDMDVDQLNAERDTVMIDVMIDGASYVLESDYVKLSDLEAPAIDPLNSPIPSFYYTREEDGFEQVNCYYHLNHFKNYLTTLEFDSVHTVPLIVDPHGVNGDDNSYFSSNSGPPRLVFGEGCVDDAEDADVIIHENGHHISWSAAPGSNSGFERRALDEAIGDYWASSYSRDLNPFDWWKVFTWDGHNTCWAGRSADLDFHYPEDVNNSIHSSGQIWSSALMDIWDDLGRTVTDRLMMQANFSFASDMTMPDAAALVLQADSLLYGGNNSFIIMKHMHKRGLMPLFVFAGEDKQKCPDETVNIGVIQPAYQNVSYSWSPDNGVTNALSALTQTSIDVSNTYTLTVIDTISGESATDDVQIFVYFCEVGIEEPTENSIRILNTYGFSFQNQNALISVRNNEVSEVVLYDLNGKSLFYDSFISSFELDSQSLPKGIYVVQVKSGERHYSTKLIKQ